MIAVAELEYARMFLGGFTAAQLGQLADVLLPAAEARQAGPFSVLLLGLIADEIDDRLQTTEECAA